MNAVTLQLIKVKPWLSYGDIRSNISEYKTRYQVEIIDDRKTRRPSTILFFCWAAENVNIGEQTQFVWNRGDDIAYHY